MSTWHKTEVGRAGFKHSLIALLNIMRIPPILLILLICFYFLPILFSNLSVPIFSLVGYAVRISCSKICLVFFVLLLAFSNLFIKSPNSTHNLQNSLYSLEKQTWLHQPFLLHFQKVPETSFPTLLWFISYRRITVPEIAFVGSTHDRVRPIWLLIRCHVFSIILCQDGGWWLVSIEFTVWCLSRPTEFQNWPYNTMVCPFLRQTPWILESYYLS